MVTSKNIKSESKYICGHCDYYTSNICHYNKHILTPKHVKRENDNQKSQKREQKNTIQESNHYTSMDSMNNDFIQHAINIIDDNGQYKSQNSQNSQKSESKYTCIICNYHTHNQYDYNKHLHTTKHKNNEMNNHKSSTTETIYSCICGSVYKYASGYYRHKKNCNYVPPSKIDASQTTQSIPKQSTENEPNWIEMMQILMKENQEIRNFMVTQHNTIVEQTNTIVEQNKKLNDHNLAVVEQNKTLTDVVMTLKPANNSYNNNTTNNNQSYTINMFLNEKCKDALNFSKFIEELKSKVDMLKIYENGYVDGISKLFIDGLSSMEVTERPLHCTDERRNTFYVHDNDEWNKDEDLKDTKKAILHISQENLKQCMDWSNDIPPNVDPDEHITQSIKLCKVAWSGDEKNTEKIIKNISKEIPLNKQVMNEI